MSKEHIEARILKGFRDLLPSEAQNRIELFEQIRATFEQSCYLPIDTPALEYSEILLGKGSDETDKQLFRFKDQGDRDIAMRFDLTVPLARYVSQHRNELNFPFRRYHIAPVWRAEKPQRGRYREFFQCDFDIIGSKDISSDIETLITASSIFEKISLPYKLRVNHRQILNSIIKHFAPSSETTSILRAIDKLEKLGEDLVKKELIDAGLSSETSNDLISFIKTLKNSNNSEIFKSLHSTLNNDSSCHKAMENLKNTFEAIESNKLNYGTIEFDLTIARGLDYYTGIVFETQLKDYPDLGSVCSGGRYDNLTSLFTRQELPGVGGSVGIDRLLVALEEKNKDQPKKTSTRVLITIFSEDLIKESFKIANILRSSNIHTEVFSSITKIGNQLKYADKNNFSHAIIFGPDELSKNCLQIKNLNSKEEDQTTISLSDLVTFFKNKD